MKKRFAAASLAAGLAGGAVAGIALTHPSISGAQTDTTTDTTAPSTTAPGTTAPGTTDQAKPDRGQWVEDALAPLVANGTITQAQADAVVSALEAAKPPMGHGRPGFGHGADLDAAATAIGITEDELRTALQSGQSLAEIAQANDVTAQTVIDALVANAKTQIAERVASGDITQAEGDEKLADLTDRITAMVNGELPARGPGGPEFHGGPPPTRDSSSPSATGASTA
jgi:hypothetical protein